MSQPASTNGLDPSKTKSFIERIEHIKSEIASEQGEFMAFCKGKKEEINQVLDEAKEAGIKKKALRAVIKTRELQGKLDAVRDDLEGDDQDSYDLIRHAIGDLAETPLGQAALARAEKGGDAVDSLTTLN